MISVIVPFYNAERFLDQCIKSILAQSFKDWELLLINDGSNDKSLEIIKSYLEKDHRIHLISQKNEGVSSARNKGLLAAKGEFVCFCDVDDYYKPNALEIMVNHFTESIDIVKCNFVRVLRTKNIVRKLPFTGLYNNEEIRSIVLPEYIAPNNINQSSEFCIVMGSLFRSSLLKDMKFISTEIMEDKVFWLEALLSARNIEYIQDSIYVYNWVPSSAMNRYHENYIQNVVLVYQSIHRLLVDNKLYFDFKERMYVLDMILFRAIIYNEIISHNSLATSVKKIKEYKNKYLTSMPLNITHDIVKKEIIWKLMEYHNEFLYFSLMKCEYKLKFNIRKIFSVFRCKLSIR